MLITTFFSPVDYLWLYILLPTIALVALLGLLLGLCCVRRRTKPSPKPPLKNPKSPGVRPVSQQQCLGPHQQNMEMKALIPRQNLRVPEVPLNTIRFLQELGEGAFGKVYCGELLSLLGNGNTGTPVAIKTLKVSLWGCLRILDLLLGWSTLSRR